MCCLCVCVFCVPIENFIVVEVVLIEVGYACVLVLIEVFIVVEVVLIVRYACVLF